MKIKQTNCVRKDAQREEANNLRKECGLIQLVAKERRCLYCSKTFTSDSASNRLCHKCRFNHRHDLDTTASVTMSYRRG
jgi:hypothetical protein